jgi:hypothetical protein
MIPAPQNRASWICLIETLPRDMHAITPDDAKVSRIKLCSDSHLAIPIGKREIRNLGARSRSRIGAEAERRSPLAISRKSVHNRVNAARAPCRISETIPVRESLNQPARACKPAASPKRRQWKSTGRPGGARCGKSALRPRRARASSPLGWRCVSAAAASCFVP